MPMPCPWCQSAAGVRVRTYKHDWWVCAVCGTTRRVRRTRYPASRVIPRSLAARVLPAAALGDLYPDDEVIADDSVFYDTYVTTSSMDVEATKWAGQRDSVLGRLAEAGVTFADTEILDVSGGPGFITAHLAAHGAARAIVTEFSPRAVEAMRRTLSIDARTFDYNSDRLGDVVDGQFDLVLIDYSIGFCVDLRGFTASLAELVRPRGHVYVSSVVPTLGCFLRWEFDEYTYNVLVRAEVLDEAFVAAGFIEQTRYDDGAYDYRAHWSWKRRLLREPLMLWYRARARRARQSVDRSLEQRHIVRLFRREPPDHGSIMPRSRG